MTAQQITVAQVPFSERANFLSRFFGRDFALDGREGVFSFMWGLANDYSGGEWKYYHLSNGGYYMAPVEKETYYLKVKGEGFAGRVSSDAAGIVATVFALNYLRGCCRGSVEKRFAALTSDLRCFAEGHPEAAAILCAIG